MSGQDAHGDCPGPQVDATKYYEACVSDACACDSGGDCECFCTAVAAYAQACRDVGVCVSWRTPEICREWGSGCVSEAWDSVHSADGVLSGIAPSPPLLCSVCSAEGTVEVAAGCSSV